MRVGEVAQLTDTINEMIDTLARVCRPGNNGGP